MVRSLKSTGGNSNGASIEPIKGYFRTKNILYVSSGRAALWLILKALSQIKPKKNEVILPAYTCPAVASSILKAGLKPVLCDINLNDFGFKTENLRLKIGENTLAVIVVYLFGYPTNIEEVKKNCCEKGVFIVEDAAQAFGNTVADSRENRLGLIGDAGFFSFGRGKPVSVLHGGLLVTSSNEIFGRAQEIYWDLHGPVRFANFKYGLALSSYKLFSNPYLYWIPQRIPSLHLGETIFEPEFRTSQGLRSAASLLMEMTESIEKEKGIRRDNSRWYFSHFQQITYIQNPENGDFPYLRYPLFIKNRMLRDKLLEKLISQGTGAALFYPCPLNELGGLKDILQDSDTYPSAKEISDRMITLPVHSGVTQSIRQKIKFIIENAIVNELPV